MQIKVLSKNNAAAKCQGDLLEKFIGAWMQRLDYSVVENVRVTATEIDLLCKHTVSDKEIYVECKAYNESTLSAKELRAFVGAVMLQEYTEGWFVSTGAYGKDAKGFVEEWEKKSKGERHGCFYYTPERLLNSLINTKMIAEAPGQLLGKELRDGAAAGEWILCISEYGEYWVNTILKNGIPVAWVAYDARNPSSIIEDLEFIKKFAELNCPIFKEGLKSWPDYKNHFNTKIDKSQPVIEVEVGDNWKDYRPARPEHFVGRKKESQDVLSFLDEVRKNSTQCRVLAITGDSGIGKSSFVAKIRDIANKKSNCYVYAVDVRAASDASYINRAFLLCLQNAQKRGIGNGMIDLSITNPMSAILSEKVQSYLMSCAQKKQLIVLIFDQFEELYCKTALAELFEEVRRFVLDVIAAKFPFVVGFSWRTDCSVPQGHPAYFAWNSLSGHRHEVSLRQFSDSDAMEAFNLFEKELRSIHKISRAIKQYILENSIGLPWLIKKLCLHLYDQIKQGVSQVDMEKSTLDIASLFQQDINALSQEEAHCLTMIAENAPMDWFEVTRNFSSEVIDALQYKRLVIRKGNKLNLYWDIFREYVLHKEIPDIPFSYIPQSTSIAALIKIAWILRQGDSFSQEIVSKECGLSPKTVGNILADLVRFDMVQNNDGAFRLKANIDSGDRKKFDSDFLNILRSAFKRHKFLKILKERHTVNPCNLNCAMKLLKEFLPNNNYDQKTLRTYATRMKTWFLRLGFVKIIGEAMLYEDFGDVPPAGIKNNAGDQIGVFIGDTSPAIAYELYAKLVSDGFMPIVKTKGKGLRNACSILMRFKLVYQDGAYIYPIDSDKSNNSLERLFACANREESVRVAKEILATCPNISPSLLGHQVGNEFRRKWSSASEKRIGGALRIWARWVIMSEVTGKVQPPPGRSSTINSKIEQQMLMFD